MKRKGQIGTWVLSRGFQVLREMARLALIFLMCSPSVLAADVPDLWDGLRDGEHVALLRHAIAPGTGDPSGFVLADCRTQRNLSAEGREQATRIGALFRANGIQAAKVYSSQWCRCLETARLLGLGPVEELPALNSFFARYDRREQQTQGLREWLAEQEFEQPVILVTHQVNITALTNVYPSSGELVVIRFQEEKRLSVIGTVETD